MRWFILLCCFGFSSVWAQLSIEKVKHNSFCGKYEKFEIELQLDLSTQQSINNFIYQKDSQSINPFDPKQISVETIFTSPSGKKVKRYGFYYQEYKANLVFDRWDKVRTVFPWRVRFSPDEIGKWSCETSFTINAYEFSNSKIISFECIPSSHNGYLAIDSSEGRSNRYLSYSETGETFFSIGNNVSSGGFISYKPSQNKRHLEGVEKLIEAGGNFTRFDMQPQAALPDWPVIDDYSSKLDEMYAFDSIVELCENNNLYFIIFRHHVELLDSKINPGGSDWSGVSWFDNPYQQMLNLSSKKEYLTDSTAKIWQFNSLRYVFSRWGYSPNFSFYGYSEVDNWYSDLLKDEQKKSSNYSEKDALSLFTSWFVDQKKFILDSLSSHMLFSNSYSVVPKLERNPRFNGMFANSDIISLHDYETIKDVNYRNRYNSLTKNSKAFDKPVLLEEMGISNNKIKLYCCTGIEYHNSIWASAMMGGIGAGLDWWWDRGVQDFGYHLDLKVLSDFFQGTELNEQYFTPQKWSDARMSKRTLENFALVSEDKNVGFGWVHNATFYWRNLSNQLPCVQELMEKGKLTYPCFVGEGHDLNSEGLGDYSLPRFEDSFTFSGGVQPIGNDTIIDNPIFKLKHFKNSFGFSKNWYEIVFYEVNSNKLVESNESNQIIKSNIFGEIKIHVPNLNQLNPDYGYKVKWIGKFRKSKL